MIKTKPFVMLILALAVSTSAYAGADYKGLDGKSLLLMCKGADKSRSLSVMCHNYLNGYLDAVHYLNPQPGFCLDEGNKKHLQKGLVIWLAGHPDGQKQAAAQAMERALKDLYPCKGRK